MKLVTHLIFILPSTFLHEEWDFSALGDHAALFYFSLLWVASLIFEHVFQIIGNNFV